MMKKSPPLRYWKLVSPAKIPGKGGRYLWVLCEYRNVELVKGSIGADHVHMYVKIQPKLSVSEFMGYLKGKSALMVFDRFPQMKQGSGRHLGARGYYVSTVGINKDVIREYIQKQEYADISRTRQPNKRRLSQK
ncbi:IS200/IS605 family transposase [Paenibacillus koleovorans]|uniref:IS200/IS605 family transposase n=1 Tax=Paenibacillus koleovorans TaxID=121608 RepID=UPI000FD7E87E